jgi:hypothetical protein
MNFKICLCNITHNYAALNTITMMIFEYNKTYTSKTKRYIVKFKKFWVQEYIFLDFSKHRGVSVFRVKQPGISTAAEFNKIFSGQRTLHVVRWLAHSAKLTRLSAQQNFAETCNWMTPKIKTMRRFETNVTIQQSTRRYITEHSYRQQLNALLFAYFWRLVCNFRDMKQPVTCQP